jgi:hypothetical protein
MFHQAVSLDLMRLVRLGGVVGGSVKQYVFTCNTLIAFLQLIQSKQFY